MKNTQKGFTLIELLVVVSIIALLSSVVLASLQGARSKARDTKRITETRSIEQALTLYALDHNGLIPYSSFTSMSLVPKNADGTINCTSKATGSNFENTDQLFNVLIAGKYLGGKPATDQLAAMGYCYVYVTSSASLAVAGAEYDDQGNLVSPIILASVGSQMARNAVFFAPSENVKTTSGNSALIGISYGSTPPVTLNVDLTTGMKHNTTDYDGNGSGSGSSGSGSSGSGSSGGSGSDTPYY
ncbi:MAG: type II secretion system protein [Patescibacteria group bacterium]